MRVLGSAVLAMELFVMGFAMLLAKDENGSAPIIYGLVFMVLVITCIRMLKSKTGWIFGSILQIVLLAYTYFVTAMWFIGLIFLGLWIAAYIVGRKGEAARAAFTSQNNAQP